MRIIKEIPCSRILCDRFPLNSKTFKLAELIKQGIRFQPIEVMKLSDGRYYIKDGRHRYTAYRLNDLKMIEVIFKDEIFHQADKILSIFNSSQYSKLRRLI